MSKTNKTNLVKKKNILRFAGIFRDTNEKEMIKYIYKARKNNNSLKK